MEKDEEMKLLMDLILLLSCAYVFALCAWAIVVFN